MYIKNTRELKEATNVRQVFFHRINHKTYGSDAEMFDLVENGEITQADIDIIKFLYEVRMATEEQILRRFPSLDPVLFKSKFYRYNRIHLTNMFVLTDEDENVIERGALKIYTIDYSAVPLLSHYTDDRDLQNWNARALITNIENIRRILLATDFRIVLETRLEIQPVVYDSYRLYIFGRLKLIPQAQMFFDTTKKADEKPVYTPYVVLCFTKDDFEFGDHTRVNEQIGRYELWFSRMAWKKSFKYAPQMIAVCDSADTMTRMKDIVEEMSPTEVEYLKNAPEGAVPLFKNLRLTCPELFNENLATCMAKYDVDKKKWSRLKSKVFAEKPVGE